MDDRIVLALGLCATLVVGMVLMVLQERRTRKARSQLLVVAALVRELQVELEVAHTAIRTQSAVIYDMACQIHGKPAADRAILEAHKRGGN